MAVGNTILLQQRAVALHLDGFSLTVVEGPDAGATVRAEVSEVSVGTSPGNGLVLADPTISRHHCSITATPDGLLLRDLGSSNGTLVSGVRVQEGYVSPGARIQLGRSTLRVDHLDEDICEALSPDDRFGALLGTSSAMRRVFAALPRVAQSDSTVLLDGETGTGKGVMAEAIHEASPRAARPFVVLDCGAIPQSLVESELFGHVKGSFTGAVSDRAGAFESAQGGTIFLDEIGELPLDMQPKLLRALEERTVKRVGATSRIKLDVRVLAATNRDLRAEVNRGTFRADLFYRLNIVRLRIPPLRERTGDIEMLARQFHEELAPGHPFPVELLAGFRRQPWPGNVRELRAAVERAVLLIDPALLALDELARSSPDAAFPEHFREDAFDPRVPFRLAKQRAADRWERVYVRDLMASAKGNVSEASRIAHMDRSHLRSLIKKHTGGQGEGEGEPA